MSLARLLWAKRHSLEEPKNLPGAFEEGAQSEVALRPCSVILNLAMFLIGGAVCAGVRAREPRKKTCTGGLVFGRSREPRLTQQELLRGCFKGLKCYN